MPARVIWSWNVRVPVRGVELLARVNNLGDAEVYDFWNYPLPGRTFSLAVRLGGHHAR